MKEFECSKCGSNDVYIEDKGSQVALRCVDCGRWIKWLGKDERRLVERYIEERNNTKVEIKPVAIDMMLGKDRLLLEIIKVLAKDKEDEYGLLWDKINTLENVMKKG